MIILSLVENGTVLSFPWSLYFKPCGESCFPLPMPWFGMTITFLFAGRQSLLPSGLLLSLAASLTSLILPPTLNLKSTIVFASPLWVMNSHLSPWIKSPLPLAKYRLLTACQHIYFEGLNSAPRTALFNYHSAFTYSLFLIKMIKDLEASLAPQMSHITKE